MIDLVLLYIIKLRLENNKDVYFLVYKYLEVRDEKDSGYGCIGADRI